MKSIDLLRRHHAYSPIFLRFSKGHKPSYTWFWTSWCGYRGAGCANNGVPIMDSIVRATRYDWSVIVLLANRRAMHGNRKKSTRLLWFIQRFHHLPRVEWLGSWGHPTVPQVKTTVGGKAGPKDYHPSQQMNRRELFLIHSLLQFDFIGSIITCMPDPSSFRVFRFPPPFSFLWKCQLTLGIPPSKKTMLG